MENPDVQKNIRDMYQSIRKNVVEPLGGDVWVMGSNGPVRIRDLFGKGLPIQTFINKDGEEGTLYLQTLIRKLRPGIHNAAQNTMLLPDVIKSYVKMANRVEQDSMRVNLSQLADDLIKRSTQIKGKLANFETRTEVGYVKHVGDIFMALDSRIGRSIDLNNVTDFSTIEHYAYINRTGDVTRIVTNPLISNRMIQDFDRDAFISHLQSVIDPDTGEIVKQGLHLYKFPAHTNMTGVTLVTADKEIAKKTGAIYYDPNQRLRRAIAPEVDNLLTGADTLHSLRTAAKDVNKADLEKMLAGLLHEDIVGQVTHRVWSLEEFESINLLNNLPDILGNTYMPREKVEKLVEKIKTNPKELLKWKYLTAPQVRSGKFRFVQENLIKLLGSGRASQDQLQILQSLITLDSTENLTMYPRNLKDDRFEVHAEYHNLVHNQSGEERAALATGANVPGFDKTTPFLANKGRTNPLKPSNVISPGLVEGYKGPRKSFVKSLQEGGILEFQHLQFPSNWGHAGNKGLFVTMKNIDGTVRPIFGGPPELGNELAAFMRPIINTEGDFLDPLNWLEHEFEREAKDKFLELEDGRGLGELKGKYSINRLNSKGGYAQVKEIASITGTTESEIYQLLQLDTPASRIRLQELVLKRDLVSKDAIPTIHQILQKILGTVGTEVNATRDVTGNLKISKHAATWLSRLLIVDQQRTGTNAEGLAKNLANIFHKLPFVRKPELIDSRFQMIMLGEHGNVDVPIGMDPNTITHPKRAMKISKYFHQNVPFETWMGFMDFDLTEEERSRLGGYLGRDDLFSINSFSEGQALLTTHGLEQSKRALASHSLMSDIQSDEFPVPFKYFEGSNEITKYTKKPIDASRIIQDPTGHLRIVPDVLDFEATMTNSGQKLGLMVGWGELAGKQGNIDILRRMAINEGGQMLDAFNKAEAAGFKGPEAKRLVSLLPTQEVELAFKNGDGAIETLKKRIPVIFRDDLFLGNTETDIKASAFNSLESDTGFSLIGSRNLGKYIGDFSEYMANLSGRSFGDIFDETWDQIAHQTKPTEFANAISQMAHKMLEVGNAKADPKAIQAAKLLGMQAGTMGNMTKEEALRTLENFLTKHLH